MSTLELVQHLQPETALERLLLKQPEFVKGLLWGVPRYGHPEGEVFKHVQEVLQNIERIPELEQKDRCRLRLAAFVHDTFKYLEDKNRPRDWSRHHSVIARQFLERFTKDQVLLELVELHDEAYYSWCNFYLYQNPNQGEMRLEHLRHRMRGHMQLFYLFFMCDTLTGDKNPAPVRWFEKAVPEIKKVSFSD